MKAVIWLLIPLLMLVYPILVYFGLQHFGPALLAALLGGAILVRVFLLRKTLTLKSLIIPLAAMLYCIVVALLDSAILLRYYPVLMSCAVAGIFIASLLDSETALEKGARLSGKFITPKAKIYLRKLTMIWSAVLLLNAAVAAYTACCANMDIWGLYNGFISYCIFAALFLGEWIYRQYYIRRYDSEPHNLTQE